MEENSSDDQLYIPQVANDRKPKTEMIFASLEEAFSFYNQYAREAGFSVRISNSKKNQKTNEVIRKKFVCFKEGHTDEMRWKNKQSKCDQQKKERARGQVRTGCKSKISLVKEQTGPNWVVSNFMESHNHPFSTPSKVHLLRSHRHVSAAKKLLTQLFSEANLPTCQQMRLLEIEYGGPECVGCTEKDIRNFENELRDEQKGIDAKTLVELFASEKEKNSAFFFEYETDSDNKFNRCFWADHVSQRPYSVFGDVVIFNTTYNTNKYEMIFAPFVGVNNHHQTIVFGCGFLSDEKTESFVWLLNKLIKAMPKGAPNVIITDQDPAMTKAIHRKLAKQIFLYRSMGKTYVVYVGREPGVYDTWVEASSKVIGYKSAIYESFKTKAEAEIAFNVYLVKKSSGNESSCAASSSNTRKKLSKSEKETKLKEIHRYLEEIQQHLDSLQISDED